jgi:hypothetical protein
VICGEDINFKRASMATKGLFSTNSGNLFGVNPHVNTNLGFDSISEMRA